MRSCRVNSRTGNRTCSLLVLETSRNQLVQTSSFLLNHLLAAINGLNGLLLPKRLKLGDG